MHREADLVIAFPVGNEAEDAMRGPIFLEHHLVLGAVDLQFVAWQGGGWGAREPGPPAHGLGFLRACARLVLGWHRSLGDAQPAHLDVHRNVLARVVAIDCLVGAGDLALGRHFLHHALGLEHQVELICLCRPDELQQCHACQHTTRPANASHLCLRRRHVAAARNGRASP